MIDKNLNTISKKDYSNKEMSELDFIRLMHALIFSSKDKARENIGKVIDIFISSKMKHNHFIDLHLALKTMIKYHYSDENEIRRLLTMTTEFMSDEELEKISSIEYRLEKVEQLEAENNKYKKETLEKDKTIAQLQEENNRLKAQLGK